MTKEEKDIIFNRLFELEERHSAFAESVRDNAYCEAIADVKLIIEGIKEPSLPANLNEAAEEYGKENTILPDNYNDGDLPDYQRWTADAFKAGAKWMAGQGETIEGKIEMDFSDPDNIYARHLSIDYYKELGPALMKFNPEDEVIVNIRKK